MHASNVNVNLIFMSFRLCTKTYTCNIKSTINGSLRYLVTSSRSIVRVAGMSGTPKRKPNQTKDVSPPPAKRKVQSTTNQKQVASFFTPQSQKGPNKTVWRMVQDSLLVAKHQPEGTSRGNIGSFKRRKVAAFDLDSTLIVSLSGKKFAKDVADWKWWDPVVPSELRKLHENGYQVIIISNQGGLSLKKETKSGKSDQKRMTDFKSKVTAILDSLDLPTTVYVATERDRFRKPRDGMWRELVEDYDLDDDEGVDIASSMFVGDAAGRQGDEDGMGKKDFACSDRDFAANVGIDFKTPEEFFLKASVRGFKRVFDPHLYAKDAGSPVENTSKSTGEDENVA